ncbi:MFS transporter [Actinoallomurus soli]|uniref:MFS transporter n=1 Tax=Actinoallomurus soli TaxID=2952535 RepID=UPI002091F0CB|nr:MFS transporter [Actinoallomurus soli]MCO5967761.1 MFS transporter [Actinoallomurus soli]
MRLSFYRPYAAMFGGIFLCLLGVGASLATLPFYVLRELHGDKVEVGVVTAAIAVAAVVTRPIAGRLGDRHGYKLVMLAGTAICVLAGAGYYAARDVPVLVAVRILHGMGEGTVYTSGAAWLVRLCPTERRGRVVGLYGISMWLGITLGALFGTVAMRESGFSAVWGLCVAVGALGLLVVSLRERPERAETAARTRAAILPAGTVVPGIALSLAALGYAALSSFVALHMAARGVSDGIAGLNAYGVTYVGVRLVIGNLPDRLGARQVAFWSAVVEAVGLLIVAVATNLVTVIIGGLVMGAGLSLLFPALALLVINRTEPSQQGAALGGFTSFWDVGLAVGGPFAGLIANASGYPAVYWVMMACAVVSALLSWTTNPQRRPAMQEP